MRFCFFVSEGLLIVDQSIETRMDLVKVGDRIGMSSLAIFRKWRV